MSPWPLLFREVVDLLLKIEVKTTKNPPAGDLFTVMGLSVTQFRLIINEGLLVEAIGQCNIWRDIFKASVQGLCFSAIPA